MAIFRAVSTDSDPELVKKTRSIPDGASLASRVAKSKASGWLTWKEGA
jgi:hypothetical protein